MPQDGQEDEKKNPVHTKLSEKTNERHQQSWFAVPVPVKRVFDRFPLKTYDANDLPLRASRNGDAHTLYIFSNEQDALLGSPSFNPSCLRWQTYFKLCGVDFVTVPSNNHASPSGSLPFLIPSTSGSAASEPSEVVPSSRLQKWAAQHGRASEESPDVRYEAFLTLIDHNIRRAWLYNVYLTENFESMVVPSYIHEASSSPFIRLTTAYELQTAASKELRKHSVTIDSDALYSDAQDAFDALESLLGQGEWFFGKKEAGLFDAAVFAYTHLLLEDEQGQGWQEGTLRRLLMDRPVLVRHRKRVYKLCYA